MRRRVWITAKGDAVPLEKLDNSHLDNIIHLIKTGRRRDGRRCRLMLAEKQMLKPLLREKLLRLVVQLRPELAKLADDARAGDRDAWALVKDASEDAGAPVLYRGKPL